LNVIKQLKGTQGLIRFYTYNITYLCSWTHNHSKIFITLYRISGPGSVVGTATGYGLDGPGIESRWGARFSAPVQTCPGAHPASCTRGTRSFPGVKSGQDVTLTPHPLLVPWSRKGRAIPLLPLWAIQPVQSLSACTRAHFTFFYLYRIIYVAQKMVVANPTKSNTFSYTGLPGMKVCHFVGQYHRFRRTYCLHFRVWQCYTPEFHNIILHSH